MKKIFHIATALMLGISATSCREESTVLTGSGRMKLSTSVLTEIKTVSRALTQEENNNLAASALIWISDNSDNCLYKFQGLNSFPSEGLPLSSGRYMAEVWVGDSVPASWDQKRYYGIERFDMVPSTDTQVAVKCTVRNTLVSIIPSADLKAVLKDNLSITVALDDGITDGSHSLVFSDKDGTLESTGYFMINSRTKGLIITIAGTDIKGNAVNVSRKYPDSEQPDGSIGLERATHYKLSLKYGEGNIEIGGAYFDIDVDTEPIDAKEEVPIQVTLAPTITGLDGVNLNEDFFGEPGAMERLGVYISAATKLSEVSVNSRMLESLIGAGNQEFVWPYVSDNYMEKLSEGGVTVFEYNKIDGVDGVTNMYINFSDSFLNSLDDGEYIITITAKDINNGITTQTIRVRIDAASVVLKPVDQSTDIAYTTAVLKASVKKVGQDMAIEIKDAGKSRAAYDDWTRVETVYNASEKMLTATVSDLQDGHDYEYRAVVDGFMTDPLSFTTLTYPQLENSGFEDWYNGGVTPSNNNKGMFPIVGPANIFWDCGNHGSLTMGGNITNRSTDSHSGNYSIEMKSQFVGIATIGKFAAGNVFYGKYLKTDGTDGELGFGRPWPDLRPRQLKGWVKYHAVAISDKKEYNALPAGAELGAGDNDQGEIYIALLSDDTSVQGDSSYPDYPVVVKTKSKKFFDPQAANVIAYGKKNFDELTSWTEFTIDLQDVHPGQKVAYIMVVCTASRYGDYFAGGRGSTMWLDDLKLVY